MRTTVKVTLLVFLAWVSLVVFRLPEIILGFLLVGSIPGTSLSIPSSVMLFFHLSMVVVVCFEILSRRFQSIKTIKLAMKEFVLRQLHATIRSFRRA